MHRHEDATLERLVHSIFDGTLNQMDVNLIKRLTRKLSPDKDEVKVVLKVWIYKTSLVYASR